VNYRLFICYGKGSLIGFKSFVDYDLMFLSIRVITICKHLKVFHGFSQVGDFYYMVIFLAIPSMGQISLSQSIKIQNLAKSPFSNVDMVWKDGFKHEG
jgi:hypothetical protein